MTNLKYFDTTNVLFWKMLRKTWHFNCDEIDQSEDGIITDMLGNTKQLIQHFNIASFIRFGMVIVAF